MGGEEPDGVVPAKVADKGKASWPLGAFGLIAGMFYLSLASPFGTKANLDPSTPNPSAEKIMQRMDGNQEDGSTFNKVVDGVKSTKDELENKLKKAYLKHKASSAFKDGSMEGMANLKGGGNKVVNYISEQVTSWISEEMGSEDVAAFKEKVKEFLSDIMEDERYNGLVKKVEHLTYKFMDSPSEALMTLISSTGSKDLYNQASNAASSLKDKAKESLNFDKGDDSIDQLSHKAQDYASNWVGKDSVNKAKGTVEEYIDKAPKTLDQASKEVKKKYSSDAVDKLKSQAQEMYKNFDPSNYPHFTEAGKDVTEAAAAKAAEFARAVHDSKDAIPAQFSTAVEIAEKVSHTAVDAVGSIIGSPVTFNNHVKDSIAYGARYAQSKKVEVAEMLDTAAQLAAEKANALKDYAKDQNPK
ncbi:hypothetical protein L0F63_006134 [Massospora cicadina]|nr:hypothetical protein L0F63_006134 [Massospora cicadina]